MILFILNDRLVDSPLEKDLMERFSGSLTAQEAILNGLDSSKVWFNFHDIYFGDDFEKKKKFTFVR